jgi:hypothetical protein
MVAAKLLALVASVGAPSDFARRTPTRVWRHCFPAQSIQMTQKLTPSLRLSSEHFQSIRERSDLQAEQNAAEHLIMHQYVDSMVVNKDILGAEWAACAQRWRKRALQDIFLIMWLCAFMYGQRKRS